MNCFYANVDTFLNKKEELQNQIYSSNPDIIGLVELKPKNNRYILQSEELAMEGYDSWPTLNSAGRGTILYTRTNLHASEWISEASMKFSDSSWCQIRLRGSDVLLVGCVYRSPNSLEENNIQLQALLHDTSASKASHLVIMGDFNFPEIRWDHQNSTSGPNHPSSKFLKVANDCFLYQHIDKPTHHRGGQRANTLDLIFTNEANMADNIILSAPIGKSHHSVIKFKLQCYYEAELHPRITHKYNKGDYISLSSYINSIDWNTLLQNKTVDDSWDLLEKQIQIGQTKYIPKRKTNSGNTKPIWMNNKALTAVKHKDEMYKVYLQSKDEKNYTAYCKARNKARGACRKAMKEFECAVARDTKSNPKAFHKYVASKTKIKNGIPELDYNGKVCQSDQEKAEALNSFFVSVFTKDDTDPPPFENTIEIDHLASIQIEEKEIRECLSKLNPCKSPGPDNIHPKILKETRDAICKPLNIIFKKSLDARIVPQAWKHAWKHLTNSQKRE